jgi:hypothetical protein
MSSTVASEAGGMDERKYQLVLQWPASTRADYDLLIELEASLIGAFDGSPHNVDGHDFGSGTMNIFIDTDEPVRAFAHANTMLNLARYPALKAAYRPFDGDEYVVIWPEGSQQAFELL